MCGFFLRCRRLSYAVCSRLVVLFRGGGWEGIFFASVGRRACPESIEKTLPKSKGRVKGGWEVGKFRISFLFPPSLDDDVHQREYFLQPHPHTHTHPPTFETTDLSIFVLRFLFQVTHTQHDLPPPPPPFPLNIIN